MEGIKPKGTHVLTDEDYEDIFSAVLNPGKTALWVKISKCYTERIVLIADDFEDIVQHDEELCTSDFAMNSMYVSHLKN